MKGAPLPANAVGNEKGGKPPFYLSRKEVMGKLNFYTVDLEYVRFLKNTEERERGFSRVLNMEYGQSQKPKFLCGIVLKVNDIDYYVPVTSYKIQKEDNLLIITKNGQAVSSLRFNYMFPIPPSLASIRRIDAETDPAYRSLLSQELRYCIEHQEEIQRLAERTYKRVLLGKNPGLVINSCSFPLLEQACREYIKEKNLQPAPARPKQGLEQKAPEEREPFAQRLARAREKVAQQQEKPFCREKDKDLER